MLIMQTTGCCATNARNGSPLRFIGGAMWCDRCIEHFESMPAPNELDVAAYYQDVERYGGY